MTRVEELKRAVEEAKIKVSKAQGAIEQFRGLASQTFIANFQGKLAGLKKDWREALDKLTTLKQELRELSGTDGNDPKWLLLARCYRTLEELEDKGIDIGLRGQRLLGDLEHQLSPAVLERAYQMEDEDAG